MSEDENGGTGSKGGAESEDDEALRAELDMEAEAEGEEGGLEETLEKLGMGEPNLGHEQLWCLICS